MKEVIPKQQFGVAIQAAIGGKIVARETVSDENGRYVFPAVPIGMYRVSASLQGFQTASVMIQPCSGSRSTMTIVLLRQSSPSTPSARTITKPRQARPERPHPQRSIRPLDDVGDNRVLQPGRGSPEDSRESSWLLVAVKMG